MAVSNSIYKVYRIAAKKRLEDGEKLTKIMDSMTKLSDKQKEQMIQELTELGLIK